MLMLILGALPAHAQSPVAQPAIKLIHLYEHTCPAGIDPRAGTLDEATAACPQSIPSVSFTLTSQDPSFAPQTHTTNSSSDTEWQEIPSGIPYSIQQAMPQGYANPVVRCLLGQSLTPGVGTTELTFETVQGRLDIGTSDLSLTYFLESSCYWFDIPTAPLDTAASQAQEAVQSEAFSDATATPAQQGALGQETQAVIEASPEVIAAQTGGTRLDIRAWQCPFHYDAAVATVEELLANCNRPHRDANFIINGDSATQQFTGDIGATSYQNVPFGTVTIQQLAYGSLDPARVFCYTQPFTASHGPLQASQEIAFTEEPGDTFSVSIDVAPGDAIDCIWFDSWITEDEYGTVLLHKYVCPDGTSTAGLDMDLLLHACPEPQVAYFQLGPSTGNETDASGYLGFTNFTPGSYLLRETEPLGYVPARIFCRSYNADDWNHIVDPWVEQSITNATAITVQLQAHWETECTWFDIKGVNYGYLDIAARSCALTFAPTATTPRLTYAQQCQGGITGATFDISSFPDFELSVTSADGYAAFQEHIPARGMTISSSGPQAYSVINVFCGDAPFIGIGAIPTSWTAFSDGFVQYDVPVDYQVVCEFYFRPIAIAAGAEASPVAVTSAPDVEASPATEGSGSAATQASPEAVPSEGSAGGTGAQSSQSSGASGNQSPSDGTVGASQAPVDANAPANLSIVAFTCPSGYDLYAEDAVPSGDCPDPAIGIDFTVIGPARDAQPATSNAGGELAWTGIAPGDSLLQAALPPEIDRAFIADCVSDQRTFPGDDPLYPFAYVGPQGQIGITLLPGESLACTWYDIPVIQGATVTAQLFTCPGATVIKTQCTPGTGPVTLTFEPAPGESGSSFDLPIGDDGSGQAAVQVGLYALTGIPIDACLVESDAFDASGQLTVSENATIEIRVYTCGG
jgi:hypothetical protein